MVTFLIFWVKEVEENSEPIKSDSPLHILYRKPYLCDNEFA